MGYHSKVVRVLVTRSTGGTVVRPLAEVKLDQPIDQLRSGAVRAAAACDVRPDHDEEVTERVHVRGIAGGASDASRFGPLPGQNEAARAPITDVAAFADLSRRLPI